MQTVHVSDSASRSQRGQEGYSLTVMVVCAWLNGASEWRHFCCVGDCMSQLVGQTG